MEWNSLLKIIGQRNIRIRNVELVDDAMSIDGTWELPPLAALVETDQVFVAAFVRCHGNIKEMERMFGISYPTVKNRLNAIGNQLAALAPQVNIPVAKTDSDAVLDALSRGDIDADEAIRRIKQ